MHLLTCAATPQICSSCPLSGSADTSGILRPHTPQLWGESCYLQSTFPANCVTAQNWGVEGRNLQCPLT